MGEKTDKHRFLPRYRISWLLILTAVVAVSILLLPEIDHWRNSTPLAESVAKFNFFAGIDPVGSLEPHVTEAEIVTAIQSRLPNLNASHQVNTIFSRIARTRRLPRGAGLHSSNSYTHSSGAHQTVWWIDLDIRTGPKTGYTLRIRQNDNPIAADSTNAFKKDHSALLSPQDQTTP